MKRVWKPLDVGGLRLYEVYQYFNYRDGTMQFKTFVVLANSPSEASSFIEKIYKDSQWLDSIRSVDYKGFPLNILMPESWWIDGIPEVG